MNLSDINDPDHLATQISSLLNETEVSLILQVIETKGKNFAIETLKSTTELLAQGGVPTKQGSLRTPGGTFFYILRNTLPKSDLHQIFKSHSQQKNRRRRIRKKLQKKLENLRI